MNKQTEKNLYFIDTSLPGDEGKYFKYILLTEKQLHKYINWFKSYDCKEELDLDEDKHIFDEPSED